MTSTSAQRETTGLALPGGKWAHGAPDDLADYDLYAELYDIEYDTLAFDRDFWTAVTEGATAVCDVGCGTGRVTEMIVDRPHVVGIDPSPGMLARARTRLPPEVELRHGDVGRIPAIDSEFDLVLCTYGSFAYVTSPHRQIAGVREIARVLRPGGRVVIDVPYYRLGHPTASGSCPMTWTHSAESASHHYEFFWQSDVDQDRRTCEILQVVDVTDFAGHVERRLFIRHRTQILSPQELVFLLMAAGFEVTDVFGGYDRRPFAGDADRLIVTGRKPD